MKAPSCVYMFFLGLAGKQVRCFLPALLISVAAEAQQSTALKPVNALENYLNMAGSQTARDFRPLTPHERMNLYVRSLYNPWGFFKAAMSSGIDQANNKPEEWGQGWRSYGQRYANIEGQYLVSKTVNYALSSALHEDNRYFGSGKHGVWARTEYALTSSLLARNDDGKFRISISQLGGVAAGAFAARLWLPASQSSAGDAAVSFGITMGSNFGISVLKEFLPDVVRRLPHKKTDPTSGFSK